ncbi:MAG: hypothetical protein MI923_20345 [Phycisphaerales bacterium]|nr:hypothetical protein [Phycisphaerales bacterium]
MIYSETFKIDGELHAFNPQVRQNHDTHLSMQFWPAYFARELLRFGVFLRAATIMLQIRGGVRFGYVNDDDDELGNEIRGEDHETLVHVFAECLNRLKASPKILEQIPGGKDYEPEELSEEWTDFLDGWSRIEFGLLKGSHAGIADKAWCRLARQFVRTTADYLVGRYAAWRSVTFTPSATTSPPMAKPVETAAA